MHISRIKIDNFRNFSSFDISVSGNLVVVGENRVGKSNLLYALRLIFDPSLPDSARQLSLSDFWDGLESPATEDTISICVEIRNFENDNDILAKLTDFRIGDDPHTVRLTYEFRPRPDLEGPPATAEDYEFVCYGGETERNRIGYDLRRRITMDVLPALRDAEGDLSTWRRSPLRPLVEEAFREIDRENLEQVSREIADATERLTEFKEISDLEKQIADGFAEMSGPKQDIKPKIGFSSTDPTRLHRSLRLLVDEGRRGIGDASLGSANLVFLSLKSMEINRLIEENNRDHTFLAIEEPEAHLHPHQQRSVYRHVFEKVNEDEKSGSLSVFLTTHSPNIASVAPLRSIVLLKDSGEEEGTLGYATQDIDLSEAEGNDIARYLDVTRAEMLFARGVILVEGDAERFLIPVFAEAIGLPLDHLGVTVCSVAGVNFKPYAKFLTGLDIPFTTITDWDPNDRRPRGFNRSIGIIRAIEKQRTGETPTRLINDLKRTADFNEFRQRCEEFGIFSNEWTLEVDLFMNGFADAIIAVLQEHPFSNERNNLINEWEDDESSLDPPELLSMVETIGKGRFAQRLSSYIEGEEPPRYIADAIRCIANYV